MKRSQLKRTPFKRKDTWKKLRHYSKNKVQDLKIYSGLRLKYLSENLGCLVCRKRNSTHVHHRKGRGIFLNDVRYFLAVCSVCHYKIHRKPSWAFAHGFSLNRLSNENISSI